MTNSKPRAGGALNPVRAGAAPGGRSSALDASVRVAAESNAVTEAALDLHALRTQALSDLARERESFVDFARRRLSTEAEADDLVQQAFARATEKVDSLREPEHARAWFYRVLRRLIADQYARRALVARTWDQLAHSVDAAVPEEAASCGCALGLLDALRPEYADILKRVDLEDAPLDVAATALGITANNASVRLHRARHRLREDLETLCGPGISSAQQACVDCACTPVDTNAGSR